MKAVVFQVDDPLVLRSPFMDHGELVRFRGDAVPGWSMIWDGRMQYAVKTEWLTLLSEHGIDREQQNGT